MSTPLHIDIVFADHTYTATCYDLEQLRRFCGDCVRSRRAFRFGSIYQYGDINLDKLVCMMNEIRWYGTYDRNLNK